MKEDSVMNDTLPMPTSTAAPVAPAQPTLVVQWGSGGEARLNVDDMDAISTGVTEADNVRSIFPIHGSFGAINLGIDGRTMWLYTHGGAFIVGELVEPHMLRARPGVSTTAVDISRLPQDQQAAILTLLNARR
jgi:hypothetical protein